MVAFSKDIIDERFGSSISGAYIKLAYFRWSDADMRAVATFSIFATATARDDGKEVITTVEVDVTDDFESLQSQLYARVKRLPEFADAVDV